jgi:Tol biopolymer transport system component
MSREVDSGYVPAREASSDRRLVLVDENPLPARGGLRSTAARPQTPCTRETRRRHRRYWALAALVAVVGVVVLILLEGGAASQTASPALSARSSVAAAAPSSKIAFISEGSGGGYCGVVYVMNADGSGQRRLVNTAESCGGELDHSWSPDGRKIAFTAWSDKGHDMYVINADGSGQQRLSSDPEWESGLAWSPDGEALAFIAGGRFADIYVMNADGSGRRRLAGDATYGELAWSPRSDKIAFARERDGDVELYVMNPDGSGQRRLTRNMVRDSYPVWSPDGRKIAFESNWQVWVMNPDGSGQRRLTRNGGRNFAPAWSPNGRRIAFERRLGRQQSPRSCSGCGNALHFEVWVMNADGRQARVLARDAAQEPSWSPDGQKIAFKRQLGEREPFGGRQSDIYVMNADGSGQRNLTQAAGNRESQPVWSPAQR